MITELLRLRKNFLNEITNEFQSFCYKRASDSLILKGSN